MEVLVLGLDFQEYQFSNDAILCKVWGQSFVNFACIGHKWKYRVFNKEGYKVNTYNTTKK